MIDDDKLVKCGHCRLVTSESAAKEWKFCPSCSNPAKWHMVEVTSVSAIQMLKGGQPSPQTDPSTSFPDPEVPKEPLVFAPSWDEFHRDCRTLADRLEKVPISYILGVARGGAIPAVMVAHMLGVRQVLTFCIQSYDDNKQQSGLWALTGHLPDFIEDSCGQGVVIIDDLVDTGKTMAYFKNKLPLAICTAVYAKPQGLDSVHLYTREVAQKIWIRFPWETK